MKNSYWPAYYPCPSCHVRSGQQCVSISTDPTGGLRNEPHFGRCHRDIASQAIADVERLTGELDRFRRAETQRLRELLIAHPPQERDIEDQGIPGEKIGRAWLAHQGYTEERIEQLITFPDHRRYGCEPREGWDCTNDDGWSRHPEEDEAARDAELILFTLEAVTSAFKTIRIYTGADDDDTEEQVDLLGAAAEAINQARKP